VLKVEKKVKIIVTLGPATSTEEDLRKIKDKGVDFVRINMSHSSIGDLTYYIGMAKKVGIPFIIDTEGSQVRTGDLSTNTVELNENDKIKIHINPIMGNNNEFNLKPSNVVPQLEIGDLIHVDFDGVTLGVSDISTINDGYVTANTITGGILGKNKAIIIDTSSGRKIELPTLSEKDLQSIEVGLQEGIGHIAASFIRSGKAVDEVRTATQNTMKIISKVECTDALEHIDEIIKKTDYILIDRGDLSKEIPIEKVPFTQKIILNKARKQNTGVFVATNFLETMIHSKKPTRAEVHDIINSIVDGAYGLTLAAETAIGKHPMECINMMNKVIRHTQLVVDMDSFRDKENAFVEKLEGSNYLLDRDISSSLIAPHGGKLVDRMAKHIPSREELEKLPKVELDKNKQMDVEQIAIGTYSPIDGFMGKEDVETILDDIRLANGLVWPIPITLDVSKEKAQELAVEKDVALVNENHQVMGILHLEDKYIFDKEEMAKKLYGTDSNEHPGVRAVRAMQPVFLAGKVTLLKRMQTESKQYELTPRQVRNLFEERGWSKVVGFHTRNVLHRSHEFIQLKAMERENCDGLFVHPVIGKKKVGDFHSKFIIGSYQKMIETFYPKGRVIFGAYSTYSRYAGPREALFTALCRQNFGCSHFIVGRDHTGVGKFYHPKAAHNIFDRFPELEIKPVKFGKVFYSKKLDQHLHEDDVPEHPKDDTLHLSGTQARKMFEAGEQPPAWFMRPEISQMVVDAVKRGEEVFVR
jgi:pyruvate kinase